MSTALTDVTSACPGPPRSCTAPRRDKAAVCLTRDREALPVLCRSPGEHWRHVRRTGPSASTFAAVRLRTAETKVCLSRRMALAMVVTRARSAERHWRHLDASDRLAQAIQGVRLRDGEPAHAAEHQSAARCRTPDLRAARRRRLTLHHPPDGRRRTATGRAFSASSGTSASTRRSSPTAPTPGGARSTGATYHAELVRRAARAVNGLRPAMISRATLAERVTRRFCAEITAFASAMGFRDAGGGDGNDG
jgi:hypothetical protein